MKTNITVLGLLAASAILLSGCQTSKTTASAWEYKVVEKNLYENELQKQIDAAVKAGWELVSVSTVGQGESTVPRGFIVFKKLRQ